MIEFWGVKEIFPEKETYACRWEGLQVGSQAETKACWRRRRSLEAGRADSTRAYWQIMYATGVSPSLYFIVLIWTSNVLLFPVWIDMKVLSLILMHFLLFVFLILSDLHLNVLEKQEPHSSRLLYDSLQNCILWSTYQMHFIIKRWQWGGKHLFGQCLHAAA